jgi:hypothetical protein
MKYAPGRAGGLWHGWLSRRYYLTFGLGSDIGRHEQTAGSEILRGFRLFVDEVFLES